MQSVWNSWFILQLDLDFLLDLAKKTAQFSWYDIYSTTKDTGTFVPIFIFLCLTPEADVDEWTVKGIRSGWGSWDILLWGYELLIVTVWYLFCVCVYVDKHVYCSSLYTCIQVCNYNICIWMYMDIPLCPVFGYLSWILHLGPGGFCHCDHLVFRGTPLPPSIGRMNKKTFGTSTHLSWCGCLEPQVLERMMSWACYPPTEGKNFETIFWIAEVSCESMSALDVGFGCAPVVPPLGRHVRKQKRGLDGFSWDH